MLKMDSNIAAVTASLRSRAENLQRLPDALTKAAAVTVSVTKRRFTNNDWAANAASTIRRKGSSRPGIDTGRLRQSIAASDLTESTIDVGTNLAYGAYLQFGQKARQLYRRSALNASLGATSFKTAGGTRPEVPPRPYLYFDQPLRDRIVAIFRSTLFPPVEGAG